MNSNIENNNFQLETQELEKVEMKALRLPEGTMLVLISEKKEYSLEEQVMAVFIEAFCTISGDLTGIIYDLKDTNTEKYQVVKDAFADLRSSWDKEFHAMLNFLVSIQSEEDSIDETLVRVPDETAILLIRSPKDDFSDKQRIISAYISGYISFQGDITKLLLTLGRTDKKTHKIVSSAIEELRRKWDMEYNLLVEHLNNL